MNRFVFVSSALVLIACGSSDTSSTTAAGGSGTASGSTSGGPDPATVIAADCDKMMTCPAGHQPEPAQCVAFGTCIFDIATLEGATAYFDCLATCAGADECAGQAQMATTPTAAADAFYASCIARADECPGLTDDYCAVLIFKDGYFDVANACLDDPCDAVESCLVDAMTTFAPSCVGQLG